MANLEAIKPLPMTDRFKIFFQYRFPK